MMKVNPRIGVVLALLAGVVFLISYAGDGVQAQTAPRYKYDPDWPKPLPNKWKMGGVTGLAVDKDDNVWVYDRPNDLTDIELEAELTPPVADCCVRPPAMIHIDIHRTRRERGSDCSGNVPLMLKSASLAPAEASATSSGSRKLGGVAVALKPDS